MYKVQLTIDVMIGNLFLSYRPVIAIIPIGDRQWANDGCLRRCVSKDQPQWTWGPGEAHWVDAGLRMEACSK